MATAIRTGDLHEAEIPEIPGKGGLGYVDPSLTQKSPELDLAGHSTTPDEFEDGTLSVSL